ncbi:unnamed protein product [Dicrocoelium dendriticum]|nr:unnamed protein product [Dicrocoelium dendriticum]
MSHERQQTLCLIRMFLQGVLSKEEQQQSVVHLDAFCSEHWTLDSIFYGTTYFPKQFLMLPSAAPVCSTAAELQCGLSDTASATPTQDDGQLTDQLPSAITAPDNSSDVDASSNHSCEPNGGNSGISMEEISLSTKQSDMRSVEASKNAPQSKKPASRANRISICQTLSDVEEEDSGLEPKVTKDDCHDNDATTATYEENIPRKNEHSPKTFPPTVDSATPVNYADQPAESRDQVNQTERITESTNMIQTCPQANFTNKVYCLPQMVTYFPTPDYAVASPAVCDSTVESTVIESSKASTLPSAYTSAYGDVLSSNADISPCHAGILLPSMDLSGTMEMNHYVGVPCSDTQLAYASYVSATTANRSDPICAPSSVPTRVPFYYFEQEPNYFVYPHHMAQPTPGVLVAYPI